MRYAIGLFILFAAAVALALLTGANSAVVSVFWPPYRFDISLNLVLMALTVLFVALHLAWRSLSVLLRLPSEAKAWRLMQKDRAMQQALLRSQSYLLAGRYTRSRESARQALALAQDLTDRPKNLAEISTVQALAHLTAARGAHFLNDANGRKHHMDQAVVAAASGNDAPLKDGTTLQAANWALEDADPELALSQLAELNPGAARRTYALKIRLRANQMGGHVSQALDTARLLIKHRAFSAHASASLLRGLAQQAMRQSHDTDQLSKVWSQLTADERSQVELAVAAVQRWAELGGSSEQARQWLAPAWDKVLAHGLILNQKDKVIDLVGALQAQLQGLDAPWLARIEKAHVANPQIAALQYLAGLACLERQLWGKAEILLTAAASTLKSQRFERECWRALAALAEHRQLPDQAAGFYKKAALC